VLCSLRRRTQDFTIEEVRRKFSKGAEPEGLGTSPQWGPGAKPRQGYEDFVPQKLKQNVKLV